MSAVAMAMVVFYFPGFTHLVSVAEVPSMTDSNRDAASNVERVDFNVLCTYSVHFRAGMVA